VARHPEIEGTKAERSALMIEKRISLHECQELIRRTGFGRLACARDNQPYIVPIYFASDSDHIYGFSTVGQKIEWMRSNPLVCVEVDEVHNATDWASVVIRGRYQELPDIPQCSTMRRRAQERLANNAFRWWTASAAEQVREKSSGQAPVLYCIQIEDVTGRRLSTEPREVSHCAV
jgi:nitroimidazol reductase NimA-like FMN-containing flavoprotein (pyridoxamine 5'-phosphate oxidase superfamily)